MVSSVCCPWRHCNLQNVAEVVSLGSDAEIVEHDIAFRVLELGALGLGLEGFLDGIKILIATLDALCKPLC